MFTGFQLFNEDVKVGKEYAGRVILKEALNETEEVVLDYKQNVFTVLFASDNFVLPEKTQYFYKLEVCPICIALPIPIWLWGLTS